MKRILAVVAVTSLLASCAPSRAPSVNEEFSQLTASVEREIRATEKTGFLWRDTEQLLQDARLAQAEGRHEEAKQLALRAMRQAKLAQEQARDNANAAPVYPKP